MNTQLEISRKSWDLLLNAIDDAYKIHVAGFTPTPKGSSIADFPSYEGANERLSELLGITVKGDESLYLLAMTVEQNTRS